MPRSWQFVGQLRAKPRSRRATSPGSRRTRPGAPRPSPTRCSSRRGGCCAAGCFRTRAADSAVASEKGYLREAGNLLFHVALFGLLISFAVGGLFKAEGGKLIVEGDGFNNTLTQYDDFKPGTFYNADDLATFGFSLDGFDASYARSGPEKGTPRTFRANIHYWTSVDGKRTPSAIEVNKPLEIGGSKVYLIGHGYAPSVTVKDGKGNVVFEGPVPFLPQDGNLTSSGVIKVMDARNHADKRIQYGFSGLFTPTFGLNATQGPHSTFPALDYPALVLTAYYGDLGVDAGLPQNVYQLDTTNMKQFKDGDGGIVRKAMKAGDTLTLPNGDGTLTFNGVKTWASFQVSHQVGNGWALVSAVSAILGLAGSLFIQRRRVWVRAVRGADGVTVVELMRPRPQRVGADRRRTRRPRRRPHVHGTAAARGGPGILARTPAR